MFSSTGTCSTALILGALLCACGRIGYDRLPLAGSSGGAGGGGAGSGGAAGSDGDAAAGAGGGGGSAGADGAAPDASDTDVGTATDVGAISGDAGTSCVDAGPPCGSVKVQYYPLKLDRPDDVWIRPHFNLINTTSADVPLSELTIRYWYTPETPALQTPACDFAFFDCANIVMTFALVSPARPGADEAFELGFLPAAGMLVAGGQTQEFGLRFYKADFSNFDETNDYSYDGSLTGLADHLTATLYRNGVLIWGIEP